jgi:hypothetical protein
MGGLDARPGWGGGGGGGGGGQFPLFPTIIGIPYLRPVPKFDQCQKLTPFKFVMFKL